jgi:N-acetylneuraminic acid mutarotase
VLVAGGYNATSMDLASSEIFTPATNSWAATAGAMTKTRNSHSATLLADGTVLVAGGYNFSTSAGSEIYHPATRTWTATTGNPVEFRFEHAATLLGDGTVLVSGGGGYNGDGRFGADYPGLARGEIYTPATGTWTAAGTMAAARLQHTATLLNDGKVLVVGGMSYDQYGAITDSELYDPLTHAWTATTGHLATARLGHTATWLVADQVLVVGGQLGGGALTTSQTSSEIYHPDTRTWSATTGSLATGRFAHTATRLADGTVLVAGGILKPGNVPITSSEIYHPDTKTWTTTTGSMVTGRYQHTAVRLPDGKVLVAGGIQFSGLASSEIYNPATQTWTATTGAMATARFDHTATLLNDGTVLVAGGASVGSQALATCEIYNPTTQTWTATTGSLGTGRYRHTETMLVDGRVLVTGGQDISDNLLASCEIYTPATGTWSTTAALNLARVFHTATRLTNDQVLVAAGLRGSGEADATHEFFDATATLAVPATTVAYSAAPQPVQPTVGGVATASASVTYQPYTADPGAGGILSGSATATAPTASGWYRVVATPMGSVSGAPATGLLTITRAPLTVTAVSQVVTLGSAPAALSATYAGFQGGDTSAVVTGAPVLATAATAASPAGSYPITVDVTALSAQNYTFTPVAGTVTVVASPAPPPPAASGSGGGGCGLGGGIAGVLGLLMAGLLRVLHAGAPRERARR